MERRTLDEICTLYSIEPASQLDAFVEGPADKAMLYWFYEETKISGRSVFDIGDVEVDDELVRSLGFTSGSNRIRVLALATALRAQLGTGCKLSFIIDRDYQDFLPIDLDAGIVLTDYCSMELYAFAPAAVGAFFRVYCRCSAEQATQLTAQVFDFCSLLYFLRVEMLLRNMQLRVVAVERLVRYENCSLSYDFSEIVSRTLNLSGLARFTDEIVDAARTRLAQWCQRERDPRLTINAHDLILLLRVATAQLGSHALHRDAEVLSAARMYLRIEAVSVEPLFLRLAQVS